jgi:hypothetical protein
MIVKTPPKVGNIQLALILRRISNLGSPNGANHESPGQSESASGALGKAIHPTEPCRGGPMYALNLIAKK